MEAIVVPKINSEPKLDQEALENDRRLNFYADTNINAIFMHRKALVVQSEVWFYLKKITRIYFKKYVKKLTKIQKGRKVTTNRWSKFSLN